MKYILPDGFTMGGVPNDAFLPETMRRDLGYWLAHQYPGLNLFNTYFKYDGDKVYIIIFTGVDKNASVYSQGIIEAENYQNIVYERL